MNIKYSMLTRYYFISRVQTKINTFLQKRHDNTEFTRVVLFKMDTTFIL